jgi:membrane protease YdiL (CAAX protease family)
MSSRHETHRPLSPLEGFLLILAFVLLGFGLLLVFQTAGRLTHASRTDLILLQLVASLLTFLAALPLLHLYLRLRGIRALEYLGTGWRGTLRALRWLPLVLFQGALLILAVAFIQKLVFSLFDYTPPPQPLIKLLLETRSPAAIGLVCLLALVFAPVIEEVLFRGLFYRPLADRFGPAPATLISALVFALIHGSLFAFGQLFVLACLLAYVYERSGRIAIPILAHFLYNTVMILLVLLVVR